MTKLAYLDCQTGIAGDMCLGALVGAGVPLEYLSEKLKGLGIDQEYQLRVESVHRNGQLATKVHVELLKLAEHHHHGDRHHEPEHTHEHSEAIASKTQHQKLHHHASVHAPTRHLPEIERLITAAGLPPRVMEWSLAVFRKLAQAEGAVHGIAPEKVHFHEVGATDAIVDIVGTCLGLDWLGIDRLYCSALPTGGGTVHAAHGRLPVPVPAVLKLWESRQVPVYSNGIDRELVTPTGAALVVTLATRFGPPPAMILQQVGNGAGSLQLPIPNILRLWIGQELETQQVGQLESYPESSTSQTSNLLETISVLETQIDDLNPQAIGYVFERLFDVGAVDVFTQAISMKKSRPGILLTVICPPETIPACEAVLFRETTTLGIRRLTQQRAILQREIQQVQTKYGEIRIKVAWSEGTSIPLDNKGMHLEQPDAQQHSAEGSTHKTIINVQPEYEDCAELAKANKLSWREVHQLALQTWYYQHGQQQSNISSTG
ncbi:MAG TPA: nickel pincer cofactor biosynthesis protein LarC [Cyanobacteria bacterium UBA8543]|nr:nickel pincer cofactor biosynthesis protein LarC [Cyanobacteria bacterium UBA8543]